MDLRRGKARAAREKGEQAASPADARVSRAERALLGGTPGEPLVLETRVAEALTTPEPREVPAFVSSTKSTPRPPPEPEPIAAVDERAADPLDGFLARLDRVTDDDEHDRPAEPVALERFLTFDLGPETYAANIVDIREIIKMTPVTPVPRAPAAVLGILSKRGVVLPVVDVAAAVGLRPPRREVLPDQRILVTGAGERTVGLRVDRVHGVTVTRKDEIGPVPSTVSKEAASFLRGLARQAENLFIIMDLAALREDLIERVDDGKAP